MRIVLLLMSSIDSIFKPLKLAPMTNLLTRWLVMALTILMIPHLVGGVSVDGFGAALACAALLTLFNFIVKPVLLLLTFPFLLLSLGLFLFVINAVLFYWAGSLVEGIYVASFGSAFFAALILSLVSWTLQLRQPRSRVKFQRLETKQTSDRRMVDLN